MNDFQNVRLTYITHYYFNGDSTGATVRALLEEYDSYDKSIMSKIHFVIVDDGSETKVSLDGFDLNIDHVVINENIQWNQAGARNVGVINAKSDKILMADIDQIFPEHTLCKLVDQRNPGSKFYKFYRVAEDGRLRKGHPNTFFMSRARFIRFYGYDEEFSGGYGAEDYRFVKNQKYHGSWQRYFSKKYWCRSRSDINRGSEYHSLKRDYTRNTPLDLKKASEIREYGGEYGHSREFLNFTWTRLEVSRVTYKDEMKRDRWWWGRWWFRTLIGGWR